MPATLPELLTLLDLETIDVGLFRGRQPETGLQRVFGGQVAAQALVAAARTVPAERRVHSLHAYFLRAGDPAVQIVYEVELTRDGGSFSTRRVVARQHGRSIFYASASFQIAEESFTHQDAMPAALPPERCPTLAEVLAQVSGRPMAVFEHEWAALDVRYAGDSRPGGTLHDPARPALAQVWVKAAGTLPADPVVHAAVLAYASDLTLLGVALVPHDTFLGDPPTQTASLDHALWFHRPARADQWLLYDQHSPIAAGARGLATGRLFTRDGVLAASVAQEGLTRRVSGRH